MIREARTLIFRGDIGTVRLVHAEHTGSFGTDLVEKQALPRVVWRTDAKAAGASSVLSDLGVYAHHLIRFVVGLDVVQICSDIATMVPGRLSDDNAHVLLNLADGARGCLWASFVAAGNRQGLRLRVFGSTGSLSWASEDPDFLYVCPQNSPHYVLRRGETWLSEEANNTTRLKAGQVEGQLEAFANIYADAAALIRARRMQHPAPTYAALCPGIRDGVEGIRFMVACFNSHQNGSIWRALSDV